MVVIGKNEQLLGLVGGIEEFLAELEGHNRIGPAVHVEQRAFVICNLPEGIESGAHQQPDGQPWIVVRGHVGQICKSAYKHQALCPIVGREIDGHGAAQRLAHQNDVFFRDTFTFGQPSAGGAGVGKDAVFIGPALASSIAAVIEYQDRGPDSAVQIVQNIGAVSDISCIAMAKKNWWLSRF